MVVCMAKRQKHTTGGIPRWSPTLVLVARFSAYVWQSGRDAQFSLTYGRMCLILFCQFYNQILVRISTVAIPELVIVRHPVDNRSTRTVRQSAASSLPFLASMPAGIANRLTLASEPAWSCTVTRSASARSRVVCSGLRWRCR